MRKYLQVLVLSLGFATVFSASTAAMADDMQYPTKWVLENKSNAAVSLTCQGRAQGTGPISDLRALKVGPRSRTVFSWSSSYYNDGLGLNAAFWSCRDDRSGTIFAPFDTGWGERVGLKIESFGGRLSLAKGSL